MIEIRMVAPSGRVFVVYSEGEAVTLERLGWRRA